MTRFDGPGHDMWPKQRSQAVTQDHPCKSWPLPTRQQRPHHWLRSPGRRATNRQVRTTSSTTPITSSIHPAVLSATATDGLNQSRAGSRFITGSAMSPPWHEQGRGKTPAVGPTHDPTCDTQQETIPQCRHEPVQIGRHVRPVEEAYGPSKEVMDRQGQFAADNRPESGLPPTPSPAPAREDEQESPHGSVGEIAQDQTSHPEAVGRRRRSDPQATEGW